MKKVICVENVTVKRRLSINKEYDVLEMVQWIFNNNEYVFYKVLHNRNKKGWFPSSFFEDIIS